MVGRCVRVCPTVLGPRDGCSLTQLSRRTTRRSAVPVGTGTENEQSLKAGLAHAPSAALAGKQPIALKPSALALATTTRGHPLTNGTKPINVLGVKSSNASTAGAITAAATVNLRKRSAFADVTNGAKAKAAATAPASATTASATASTSNLDAAPHASSSTTTRRTYRTRSSTGGSAMKDEEHDHTSVGPSDELTPEDYDDHAMAIDEPAATAAPVRQIRPMRKVSIGGKVSAEAPIAATRRPALAPKRVNASTTSTTTVSHRSTTVATTATSAATLRARQRRELAELAAKAAADELELARQEEAEAQHRSKKLRTSEPEYHEYDDEEDADAYDEVVDVAEKGPGLDHVPAKDEGWEDLDEGDEEDPLMVSAYVVEVYDYLKELELTTMPETDYMANQNEITWKMRGILIDWLVEIHTKFRLLPETIFLATNIIDRFLSTRVVSLVKFQLVGVTALFIAAKYEEVVCPSVANFLYMTDGGYGDDEILKAERYVLSMIEFNLSYPNPINFLRRISKADGYDIQSRTMAKFLMEISIVDHKFMGCPPSLIAAAGNWLARKVLDKGPWDANLVHYSGYSEEELKPTAQLMLDYVVRTSPTLSSDKTPAMVDNPLQTSPTAHEVEHPNFIKKYAAKKFFRASTQCRKWAEEHFGPTEVFNPKKRKVERIARQALL
ncbi:BQ5605_C005g03612 [Microbotryum silenes-dioicae]|uniref:BQ5605_C005g03612 protein n=1 Tax=Microbotryum silenes-dioicae TaxID=796604 RepID=A0A2X0MBE9_9BASI|nr:BQ5605_C005g03612 [Microbotryum silenes-dioicae]